MINIIKPIGRSNLPSRAFTFNQLSKISDDNYGVLNRSMDLSKFNTTDVFILTPIMEHYHAFGEKVEPHLRTQVSRLDRWEWLALQDLTYEQWEQGKEITKIAC